MQADIVLMHAPQEYPELYMELEAEFGDTILNNGKGIELIISSLESRFWVNKQAYLIKHFDKFTGTSRILTKTCYPMSIHLSWRTQISRN